MRRFQQIAVLWRRRWRERVVLLALLAISVAGLVRLWDQTLEGWFDILYWEQPLPSAAPFHDAIRDADSIVVRDGGYPCCASVRDDPILFTVTNRNELAAVYDGIEFISFTNVLSSGCACCGWPGIDWYRNGKRVALTSVQHGHGIRWKGFGTLYFGPLRGYGDIPLTTESAIWLIQWMRSHGITNADYSERQLERLKKIAHQASEATSEPAPGAASSSPRG